MNSPFQNSYDSRMLSYLYSVNSGAMGRKYTLFWITSREPSQSTLRPSNIVAMELEHSANPKTT